jgi:hypothetical protein
LIRADRHPSPFDRITLNPASSVRPRRVPRRKLAQRAAQRNPGTANILRAIVILSAAQRSRKIRGNPVNPGVGSNWLRQCRAPIRHRLSSRRSGQQMIHHPLQRINLLRAWSRPVASLGARAGQNRTQMHENRRPPKILHHSTLDWATPRHPCISKQTGPCLWGA